MGKVPAIPRRNKYFSCRNRVIPRLLTPLGERKRGDFENHGLAPITYTVRAGTDMPEWDFSFHIREGKFDRYFGIKGFAVGLGSAYLGRPFPNSLK